MVISRRQRGAQCASADGDVSAKVRNEAGEFKHV